MEGVIQHADDSNHIFPFLFLRDSSGLLCMVWHGFGNTRMIRCGWCFKQLPVSGDNRTVQDVATVVKKHLNRHISNGRRLVTSWTNDQFIENVLELDYTISDMNLPNNTANGMVYTRSQLDFLLSKRMDESSIEL